jgi:F-type H+-transporting ATPase subunit b
MLDLDLATVAFQIANFLILAALLYYFLFRPTLRKMREDAAAKELLAQQMASDREEIATLRAQLAARLEKSEEEASLMIRQAQEQAEAERAKLLQAAEAEIEEMLMASRADTRRFRRQELIESNDELLDAILDLSGGMIGRAAPPEVHDALLQQLSDRVWEMGRSEMEQVETFRRSLGDRTPTAHVASARPLSPEQQGLLVRTFTALADRRVNLELQTEPSLAAGVRVRLGDMVIDNSIADRLEELRESVSQALLERLSGE